MAGTDDDNNTPSKSKLNFSGLRLPAGFAEHCKLPVGLERLKLPPEFVRQLKAALAPSPEIAKKLKRLVAENCPEVREVRARVLQHREVLQIYEAWLADHGFDRESQPATPVPQGALKPLPTEQSWELLEPLPDPEAWLDQMRLEFSRQPEGRKSAWIRETAYPQMQRDLGQNAPWHSWESLRRAMNSGRKRQGEKKF